MILIQQVRKLSASKNRLAFLPSVFFLAPLTPSPLFLSVFYLRFNITSRFFLFTLSQTLLFVLLLLLFILDQLDFQRNL